MNTDNTKYGVSKEDIRKAALGDFDDFEPEVKINEQGPSISELSAVDEKEVTISVEDIPSQQTMMFCTMCGRQLPSTAKFCTGCGNPISAPADDSVQDSVQQDLYSDIYSNDVQYDYYQSPDTQPIDTLSQVDTYAQDYQYQNNRDYQDNQYAQQTYQQDNAYAQGAQYQQNNVYVQQPYNPPIRPLKTDRNGIVALLLSFVTFGIYGLIYNAGIADDVNTVCSRFDGKKTMNFWLMTFIVAPLTLGIGAIVWTNNLCARIGRNLTDRGISYNFGAGTFWGWGVLGSFIVVGPFIFMNKLATAMNLINEDYNMKG